MKKILFLVVLISIGYLGNTQKRVSNMPLSCDICLKDPSACNTPFFLHQGNNYTFTTTSIAGATYSWSVTGGGLVIVGPRDQSNVEVKVVSNAISQICLTKSIDGQPPCCTCFSVIIDCGSGGENPPCPSLGDFYLTNTMNSDNSWCCDAAQNFLVFNWLNNTFGYANITITDLSFNVVAQFYHVSGASPGGGIGWPNGIYLSNQNPPPCGEYLIKIVNECNPEDVIGGFIEVKHCVGVPKKSISPDLQTKKNDVKLDISPNPVTNNNLKIAISNLPSKDVSKDSKIVFKIIDIGAAKIMGTWSFGDTLNEYNINTSSIPKGVYLLTTNVDGKNISKKIVIQ